MIASLFFTPPPARAQVNDTQLLSAILCEIKELRGAVQQAQVVAPLLEANLREREHFWKQRTHVDEQLAKVNQEIEVARAEQTRIQVRIADIERSGRDRLSEPEIAQHLKILKAMNLRDATAKLQQVQNQQIALSTESGHVRGRLAELEEESGLMQRQLQSLAVASSAMCEGAER